jgi:integrase
MNTKRPKKKEPWPRIRAVVKNGKPMIMVDCRINGRGERKYFATIREAEGEQQRQRVRRANEGLSGMAVPEKLRVEAMDCQHRLQPFNASLTDAVDFFLRHAKPAGGHRTAKQLVEEFIEAKRVAGRREEYLRIQASVLGLFEKAFPDAPAHEISSSQIEAWLGTRGESLRTRRNYQNDVRNLFNFAVRRGYVASNPVDRLEKIILDERPVEILSVAQAARLLEAAEAAGGTMTPFIAVGLFAGLRTREIAVLDWRDVDLAEKTIMVHAAKTKTRARRIVEISDNLKAWLIPYSLKTAGPVAPDHYRQKFEDTRRDAGIDPWPRNAMRHSAASYHLAAHRNESLTQAMLGHESGKMLIHHYRELVKPKAAARYWQIMPSPEAAQKVIAIA